MKQQHKPQLINLTIVMALLSSAILIAFLAQLTSIDIVIQDYYFDFNQQLFTYKDAWFANILMHQYIKNLIIIFAVVWIILVIIDALYPVALISTFYRVRLRFVATAAILVPAVISVIKHQSALHCPWHLQRYGGQAMYIKLFDSIPAHFKYGHCFPAGHASTGLWLASLCVFWFPHRPRTAWTIYFMGLLFGFGLGWVQQMRGAHFLSHTLWSVWLSATMVVLMLWIVQDKLKQNYVNE